MKMSTSMPCCGQPAGQLDHVDVHAAGVAGAGLVERRGVQADHRHPPDAVHVGPFRLLSNQPEPRRAVGIPGAAGHATTVRSARVRAGRAAGGPAGAALATAGLRGPRGRRRLRCFDRDRASATRRRPRRPGRPPPSIVVASPSRCSTSRTDQTSSGKATPDDRAQPGRAVPPARPGRDQGHGEQHRADASSRPLDRPRRRRPQEAGDPAEAADEPGEAGERVRIHVLQLRRTSEAIDRPVCHCRPGTHHARVGRPGTIGT